MNVGIQSLWVILTVMVPGLVFYGALRLVLFLLGEEPKFINEIHSSETLTVSVLFSIMFILQIIGIVTESMFFKLGPYKHADLELQAAFDKRYEIIASMDSEKDYHVERILGQFFMSHNIAVGMTILLLGTGLYLFAEDSTIDPMNNIRIPIDNSDGSVDNVLNSENITKNNIRVPLFMLILVIALFSWYVPYNRFDQSCKALHSHLQKDKKKKLFKRLDKKPLKYISFNLVVISCILIGGGIGQLFGDFGEGIIAGIGVGFILLSLLRDKPKIYEIELPSKKLFYPLLSIGFVLIIIGFIFDNYICACEYYSSLLKNVMSFFLIITGLGIGLTSLISFKFIDSNTLPFQATLDEF